MNLPRRKRNPLLYLIPAGMLAIVVGLGAVLAVGASAKPKVGTSSEALARISTPFGAGKLERVSVVAGTERQVVPVKVVDDEVWPLTKMGAGEQVEVIATFKRPSWNSWLSKATEKITYTTTTPLAKVTSTFITRHKGDPLSVSFSEPVALVSYTTAAGVTKALTLAGRQRSVQIAEASAAGTVQVASAARSWESATSTAVTWFPNGASATAIASPSPGTKITSATPITLTFSKPVAKVLDGDMPVVSPSGSGSWETVNAHTIRFVPSGYGYGLGATVSVDLPAGIELVGGTNTATDPVGKWTVPAGSTLRLQELLADLGYLPVSFTSAGSDVANTVAVQEAAASDPPSGKFSWRYSNTPSSLTTQWSAGTYGELTTGALMAFENDHGLDPDGVAGATVWKALIQAEIAGQKSTFGYTYVHVSETDPERVVVWHNGKNVVTGLVNTGVAGATTQTGTFAVFEHLRTTTMSGTNVDGSTYKDPGIPWVSYFNGGDALHGYIRASYGWPQSNGCVEMPYALAAQVWPYTPVGTIVQVVS